MIRVILLESDKLYRERLIKYLDEYYDLCVLGTFKSILEEIDYIYSEQPDIIFVGIHMLCQMNNEIVSYINKMKFCKIILVLYEEKGIRFIEFKEVGMGDIDKLPNILLNHNPVATECNTKELKLICNLGKRKIKCFGKLFIENENGIAYSHWRTKKVKELFAYIISKYDKVISKDELLRILFHGEDQKKSINHLYVTMSYLRKQLEVMGISRQELTIDTDYNLYIRYGVCDYVDFDLFVTRCQFIDDSNILEAEEIEILYTGMFLEEEDYVWAYDIREHSDKKYEELLIKMSYYYKNVNRYDDSEKCLLKIIEHNALSVIGYNEILNLYMIIGKDDYFKKEYVKYEEMLREEFDELPEEKYRDYYWKLKR